MKARLDILLVQKNLATSRERAKELIIATQVFVDGVAIVKPSQLIENSSEIIIKGEILKYVGRGGLKLEKAILYFNINLENLICGDIGASTGGFTDCMLQNNALKVYAVDVGHDQLAKKLLQDSRVVNLEGINVRQLTKEHISETLDFVSIDVSFISIKLIFPKIKEFLKDNAKIVVLIKPQFEVGKPLIGKNGIVKSEKIHITLLQQLIDFFIENSYNIIGITYSPVKGSEGNIEYLAYLENSGANKNNITTPIDYKAIVKDAFSQLNK